MAKQLEMMYEGKAKQVFATDDPTLAVIHYKDDATAFNGLKKGTIVGKGVVNNLVSNHLFKMLEANGVKTHLVEQLNERDSVVRRVSIVPIEVIVRNIAAGSLSKRLGLPEGTKLKTTVLEYCYKNDDLGDPMINDYHIAAMELATKDEMAQIAAMALKVNELLTAYLKDLGIELIDFKLEFGRFNGEILLADEISPDTCRFWDSKTGEKLDKDRFRRDLGHVEDAYQEILRQSEQENLYLVLAGQPTANASELLAAPACREFVEACRKVFDVVILDTPPAALLADASELAVLADGALMTVRQNYASRSQIMEGAQILSDSHLPLLGCVLNYASSRSPYGGYYGYGYGGYGRAYGEKKEKAE